MKDLAFTVGAHLSVQECHLLGPPYAGCGETGQF